MNRFLSLLLAAFCLTAVGQSEYPYPYNPDGNNDGYIGLTDLLDLLTAYGQDFTPDELAVSDDAAIIDLGPMFFGRCIVECSKLEGDWRVSDIEGLGAFEADLEPSTWYWTESIEGGVGGSSTYRLPAIQNTTFETALVSETGNYYRCACLTRAYPGIEYKCLQTFDNAFESAAQALIDEGYHPLGGPTNRSGYTQLIGCFWRLTE